MKRVAIIGIMPAALLAATCRLTVGDVFVLTTGGRVAGRLINPDESPREKYLIETLAGTRITLDSSQVKEVLRGDGSEAGGGRAEIRTTAESGRDDGRSTTHEELMRRRGYLRFGGDWKTPLEIALIEKQRKIAKAQGEWVRKLKRWSRLLGGQKDGEARGNIRAIDDPHAVKALAAGLQDDRPRVRILFVETLASVGTAGAAAILSARSLEDPVEEVRLTCLDYLKTKKDPDLIAYYVGALGSKDNALVNRAAVALGRMNDPSAIGPLIDALVTTHKQKIAQGSPGSLSPTFGVGPGGAPGPSGLAVGGRTKIIAYQLSNQAVLDALVTLSGQNFQFHKPSWRQWHAAQRSLDPMINLRRD